MAELISKHKELHSFIWKCECSDYHYVEIAWDDDDPDFRFLEIVDTFRPQRYRDRIVAAVKMARGKSHTPSAVILDNANVADIIAVLSKHSGQENGT